MTQGVLIDVLGFLYAMYMYVCSSFVWGCENENDLFRPYIYDFLYLLVVSSANHPLKGEGRFLILAKVEPHCFSVQFYGAWIKNACFYNAIYLETI